MTTIRITEICSTSIYELKKELEQEFNQPVTYEGDGVVLKDGRSALINTFFDEDGTLMHCVVIPEFKKVDEDVKRV